MTNNESKKQNDNLSCIIHYPSQDIEAFSVIKEISSINEERIRLAKTAREQYDDENYHIDQCESIPETIDKTLHGIHLTPCYKKFTLILAKTKVQTTIRTSTRMKSPPSVNTVYPKECNICKKYKLKIKGKTIFPITITTINATETIKTAAMKKDEQLFYEIQDLDLISKEFKYHSQCYKDFTRGSSKKGRLENQALGDNELPLNDDEVTSGTKDIDAVKKYIERNILIDNKAISMLALQEIYYGQNKSCVKSRYRFKQKLIKIYGKKLLFLSVKPNSPAIVINANTAEAKLDVLEKDASIRKVAGYLRTDIQEYCQTLPDLSWPPPVEELCSENRLPPASVTLFLTNLLKTSDHAITPSVNRLVESYSDDFIYGVSRGTTLTKKHFLLGVGLHNLTGQKKVIQITNRLGHSISYDKTCEIEHAQAQKAQILAKKSSALPLKPSTINDYVLTTFWVDNFDLKVETQTGGGAINITTLMAFQEETENSTYLAEVIDIPKSKKKLSLDEKSSEKLVVNTKQEPIALLQGTSSEKYDEEFEKFERQYYMWLILRKQNSFDQIVANFPGWLLKLRERFDNNSCLKKTVESYLPPITTKVTDFNTIHRYMSYLQKLAKEVNMPYVNITLDVGAAINAFKFLWNYHTSFRNIVIHLGDFHFMKENFKVLGTLIANSGFEDFVYQAGICTSGSLLGVIKGSQYNRGWLVHGIVAEVFERLLLLRYTGETNTVIPAELGDPDYQNYDNLDEEIEKFDKKYESFREKVRHGSLGRTPQFWIIYLDLMKYQHMAHTAVQTNNFDMRTLSWEKFLPFYFALNMVNYARYGSYYVEVLKNMEENYPGLRNMLKNTGLSVQAQNRYPLRTPIDQRGEQTINRDAKTPGGVKFFSTSSTSVLKWCLNRSEQATNTKALNNLAGLGNNSTTYKSTRPSQILRSEEQVKRLLEVLQKEYLNPFDIALDKTKLFNLSSGLPLDNDIAKNILLIPTVGEKLAKGFRMNRIVEKDVAFHSTIKRNNYQNFSKALKTVKITKNNKIKVLEVNRNIISTLLSFTIKTGKSIDFEAALKYPLSPIPLSIANADGSKRETSKAKLKEIILSSRTSGAEENYEYEKDAFVLDMIAVIRTMSVIPETFKGLAQKFVKSIPSGYDRVDIVADTYREQSLKNMERQKRGESTKILIKSLDSKIPRDFSSFLLNGENKTRLIELIASYIDEFKVKVFNILRCSKVLISLDNKCMLITRTATTLDGNLTSNQEEADSKVILHCCRILREKNDLIVTLRSPSGDTDIVVLAVALLNQFKSNVILDDGNGKQRKIIRLSDIDIDDDLVKAMIGFHSFSGNDYVSSFFRKGKEKCWKLLEKTKKFQVAMEQLGSSPEVSSELYMLLEEYVCQLYGYRCKSIDSVRYKMYTKKFKKENKVIDMASLPPCSSVLRLHTMRSNTVAYLWKQSTEAIITVPNISNCGWTTVFETQWVEEVFPSEIEEIILNEDFDEIGELLEENEEESDDDDEFE